MDYNIYDAHLRMEAATKPAEPLPAPSPIDKSIMQVLDDFVADVKRQAFEIPDDKMIEAVKEAKLAAKIVFHIKKRLEEKLYIPATGGR